jgi:hypothetical protein
MLNTATLGTRHPWIGYAAVAALSYAFCDLLHETAHALTTLFPLGVQALSISTVAVTTSRSSAVVAAAGPTANVLLGLSIVFSLAPNRTPQWRFFWWLFGSLNLFNAAAYLLYSAALNGGDLAVALGALTRPAIWRPIAFILGLPLYVLAVRTSLTVLRRLVTGGVLSVSRIEQSCMVPYWTGGLLLVVAAALNPVSRWLVLTSGAAVGFGAMAGLVLLPRLIPAIATLSEPPQESPHFGWGWLLSGVIAAILFVAIFGPGVPLRH